jgi:hypothetical protein
MVRGQKVGLGLNTSCPGLRAVITIQYVGKKTYKPMHKKAKANTSFCQGVRISNKPFTSFM